MAIVVYKDGVSERIEPERLQGALAAGWSLTDPNRPKRLPPGVVILNPESTQVVKEEPKEEPTQQAVELQQIPDPPRQKRKYTKRAK